MKTKIILASNSTYRKAILNDLQIPFCVLPSNIDENISQIENIENVPLILAQNKAQSIAKYLKDFENNSNILKIDAPSDENFNNSIKAEKNESDKSDQSATQAQNEQNQAINNKPSPPAQSATQAPMEQNQNINALNEALKCDLILAGDTVLIFQNKIIGKQPTEQKAKECLKLLSGQSHKVISAIALLNRKTNKIICKKNTTIVQFKTLSNNEIENYLKTNEWQGAAGAYRIQQKGAFFVKKITGSFTSVAGLPISELYDMLLSQGYPVWQ